MLRVLYVLSFRNEELKEESIQQTLSPKDKKSFLKSQEFVLRVSENIKQLVSNMQCTLKYF